MKLMRAYDFVYYAKKQILENRTSPDALCGEAKRSGRFREIVSAKTLYNYVDKRILKVRNIDLPLKVKRKSPMNRLPLSSIGAIIYLVKSSITSLPILFFITFCLILHLDKKENS